MRLDVYFVQVFAQAEQKGNAEAKLKELAEGSQAADHKTMGMASAVKSKLSEIKNVSADPPEGTRRDESV